MMPALAATYLALFSTPLAPRIGKPVTILRIAQADVVDGFVASCTGNFGGTGQCINQETSQRFTCVIIPGQVIDCKSSKSKPFQCVWISGVQANYADFWCDQQVDTLLRNEVNSQSLQPSLTSPLGPGPSGGLFPANEINPDRYTRDRFKPDDSRLDDPFAKPPSESDLQVSPGLAPVLPSQN